LKFENRLNKDKVKRNEDDDDDDIDINELTKIVNDKNTFKILSTRQPYVYLNYISNESNNREVFIIFNN
jgi:hypothetical protein